MSWEKQIRKALEDVEKQVKKDIEGEYSLTEVMDDDFIRANTDFVNLEELIEKAPVTVTQENLASLSGEEMNEFISSNTKFDTWLDLLKAAKQDFSVKLLKSKGYKLK